MNDQERLDKIMEEVEINVDGITEEIRSYELTPTQYEWFLVKMGEKQELEMLRKHDAKDYAQLHYFLNGRTNRLGESVVNIIIDLVKELEQQNKRYEEWLEYISKIEQPDGGYVSGIEVAVTAANNALQNK
ncbi:hypothetical protein SAMN04487943_101325 [Gracilibacillus orientalis]|uniref:Uncharacterized protein n=1 Tax=Gracilibacillus orientalis TaxID=334253 RepID=A0A1I4HAP6_9BACI|nr:hypothetical protein [Gracilibacillus orientalis]SFL39349.1 hypothetical protein SAMN04487943_101325 [Gracilibacillus orientalis]